MLSPEQRLDSPLPDYPTIRLSDYPTHSALSTQHSALVKEAQVLTAQQLAEAHGRNVGIIKAQTAGLTHDESLLQLPFRGNCMNWVIGHILEGRNTILDLLGAEPAFDPA